MEAAQDTTTNDHLTIAERKLKGTFPLFLNRRGFRKLMMWSFVVLHAMCVPVTGDTEIKTPTFFLGIRTVPKRM
jgi:hypothetical protein